MKDELLEVTFDDETWQLEESYVEWLKSLTDESNPDSPRWEDMV